jgi:hypothetical protein
MNEIMVWEPIDRDFVATCSCEREDCYQTVSVDYDGGLLMIEDEVNDKRAAFTFPPHLRLCRSVPWYSAKLTSAVVNDLYDKLGLAAIDYQDAWLVHEQLHHRLKASFDEQVTSGEVAGKNDYERRHNHRVLHADEYGTLFGMVADLSTATRELELAKLEVKRMETIVSMREWEG